MEGVMASTFKSNDTTIVEILKDIDRGANQLPDFQRGWVWDDERIRALIVSIYSAYPVGALMFLEYGGDLRFKCRAFTNAVAGGKPNVLVLDGQQRLTSIYCAMFSGKPVPTQTVKKESIERYYYLDIQKCLSGLDDRTVDRLETVMSIPTDRIIRKNFARDIEIDLSSREREYEQQMFPLNIVFNRSETAKWRRGYNDYYKDKEGVVEAWDRFETEILDAIFTYSVPVITLSMNTPKEAVCQVFENVNTGGVSLTVFELVTASFAAEDFDLRGDWYGTEKDNKPITGRYDRMKEKENILSVVSDVDFLVALTLLSRYYVFKATGKAVGCKKQDVLDLNLSDFNKYKDALSDGFIQAARFLGEQRIFSERDLPYTTQFIPFSVLFAVLKQRAQDGTVRKKLSQWYWCGVLGEMYGAANETRYANDVTKVMEWIDGGDEPDTVTRSYFQPLRLLSLQTRNSAAYKGIMALILKAKALDFISGKEMDFTAFSDEQIDIHHIFPRAYCEYMRYDRLKWNSVVNKTPIASLTNRVLGGHAPSIYMKLIENDKRVSAEDANRNVASHLIDVDDLRADRFDDYFIKRAKSLLKLISEATGKTISNLNGDDVISAFGGALL
jgi:hypothetical protein